MVSRIFFSLFVTVLLSAPLSGAEYRADVVIYGGTAGGAIAAIAAAEQGASVILVEPRNHLGGMLTGGLGRTDMDRQQHLIGGLAREFFVRVGRHYGEPIVWTFEPKVAQAIVDDWVRSAGVKVFLGKRLSSVEKEETRIISITTETGDVFRSPVFVDSSYEGDLMARAGGSYVVGREGREKYHESLAGIKEIQPGNHQLHAAVSPYDARGRLLPYVVDESGVGPAGQGDNKVQAYCFRVCLTNVKENQVPIERPEGYDPERYELVKRYLQALEKVYKRVPNPLGISMMPNGKTDINSSGAVATNLLSASWDYPEADYRGRQEIWDEHLGWTQGLIYFLANDPAVPEQLRQEMQQWGLPKDEFVDTGHWPHQLYVREARRMVGEYVMTQHDLQTRRKKYDSIGMGGYNMDVREVQWIAKTVYRFPMPVKEVLMEGYITVPVDPYEIPYRALLPRRDQCSNLLVTSCISATHMAYSSIRMEPQYMILGQAAGVAAAMTSKSNGAVHYVDIRALQGALKKQGQVLSSPSVAR